MAGQPESLRGRAPGLRRRLRRHPRRGRSPPAGRDRALLPEAGAGEQGDRGDSRPGRGPSLLCGLRALHCRLSRGRTAAAGAQPGADPRVRAALAGVGGASRHRRRDAGASRGASRRGPAGRGPDVAALRSGPGGRGGWRTRLRRASGQPAGRGPGGAPCPAAHGRPAEEPRGAAGEPGAEGSGVSDGGALGGGHEHSGGGPGYGQPRTCGPLRARRAAGGSGKRGPASTAGRCSG